MAKLSELRKKAKALGIAASVIRSATTASELQSVIDDHGSHGKPRKKSRVVKKAVAKKSTARKATARKSSTTRKSTGRKASTPAKSRKSGKAKRSSNSSYEPKGGRNLLDRVNFSKTDGWNAREGSAPDRIIKALKRFKGDRTKVFNHLKSDIRDFVNPKKRNGQKRTKAEMEAMLRYRISRTAWDFAMRTGQHEAAENRVEYGTGGTGNGTWKPARKTSKPKAAQSRSKAKPKAAAKKAGRKPAKAQRRSQGRRAVRKTGRAKAGSRR